jgi:hypothetical protein
MLRPRFAIAALVIIVGAAGGITAGVISSHRAATALDAPATTVGSPATTVEPSPAPAGTATQGGSGGGSGATGGGATRTTGRTTDVTATTGKPTGPPRISDPARAAAHLFDAWQGGDRELALQAASPSAVRALFAIDPTPRPHFSACRSVNLGFDCQYGYSHDNGIWFITMRVEGGASAGYRVASVQTAWRFTDPAASAKHLLDSWRANDRVAAGRAASKAAVDAMFRDASRSNPPRPLGCSFAGIDSGYRCNYTGAEGGLLIMHVKGGASAGWFVTEVTEAVDN